MHSRFNGKARIAGNAPAKDSLVIDVAKWLCFAVFGVWALLLVACLIYLGRLYLASVKTWRREEL